MPVSLRTCFLRLTAWPLLSLRRLLLPFTPPHLQAAIPRKLLHAPTNATPCEPSTTPCNPF